MTKNKKDKVNKYADHDDISDVTGVRSTDHLLQVGTNLKFMKKYVKESKHVESIHDVGFKHAYDRIFIKADEVDEFTLGKLGCLNMGTVVIFEEDDEKRAKIAQEIKTKWYPAEVWDLTCNIGKCLITDLRGPDKDWMKGYVPRD